MRNKYCELSSENQFKLSQIKEESIRNLSDAGGIDKNMQESIKINIDMHDSLLIGNSIDNKEVLITNKKDKERLENIEFINTEEKTSVSFDDFEKSSDKNSILAQLKIKQIKQILEKNVPSNQDLIELQQISESLFAKVEAIDNSEPFLYDKLQFMKHTIDFLKSIFRVPELRAEIILENKEEIEKILISLLETLKMFLSEDVKENIKSCDFKDSNENLMEDEKTLQKIYKKLSFKNKRILMYGQKIKPNLTVNTKIEDKPSHPVIVVEDDVDRDLQEFSDRAGLGVIITIAVFIFVFFLLIGYGILFK